MFYQAGENIIWFIPLHYQWLLRKSKHHIFQTNFYNEIMFIEIWNLQFFHRQYFGTQCLFTHKKLWGLCTFFIIGRTLNWCHILHLSSLRINKHLQKTYINNLSISPLIEWGITNKAKFICKLFIVNTLGAFNRNDFSRMQDDHQM